MERSLKERVVSGFLNLTSAQKMRVKLIGIIGQFFGMLFAMLFIWWFGYWYFLIFMGFALVGLFVDGINTAQQYREARFLDRIRETVVKKRGDK